MKILKHPFGDYGTNCYILCENIDGKDAQWIIDPGMGAFEWVMQECKNPQAILLTHGHFDHIFDVAKIKQALPEIPIYCPEKDCFMLEEDFFDVGITPCKADKPILNYKSSITINIQGLDFIFHHLPGHTPGCSIIEYKDHIFSGDFVFRRSIGRFDFPYSSPKDMKESLQRFRELPKSVNKIIHPGHGADTELFSEQENVASWIQRI
ncbi:MBL fold metallo-hydrolase [Helicobacter mustelae]|uniref:Putative hydrolase n=1 Tax=Helicobacter mustelae (strain ATCC 43772 / CCUG 25715 / CIP 103759 / LMG 18044 / NCTC 12198 / R85-136P) TaxID=679897 RepID=D3UH43_HELM1|nr:MBL fold metallo-hydrolase [Helicobacter mustelae]CBG39815.1 putative hydrolase [Helicobacter mustelae 12198]SQH71324.1 hydrolase [Helicobacter mustelae]STP12450.1 hydrolase [Helicobacter mustelae]